MSRELYRSDHSWLDEQILELIKDGISTKFNLHLKVKPRSTDYDYDLLGRRLKQLRKDNLIHFKYGKWYYGKSK